MNSHRRSTDAKSTRHSVIPKSLVCPGTLSKNINKQFSTNASLKLQHKQSYKLLKERVSRATLSEQEPGVSDVTASSNLVISSTQGIFQIHLKYFDLSDTAAKRIENAFLGELPVAFRLSWKFLSFERTTIPLTQTTSNRYDIESSVLYKVDINEDFFEHVLNEELSLEFYASSKNKDVFLARGELKISDCLEYPMGDLYSSVEFCDADKALVLSNTGISVVYGTLVLCYRLNYDEDVLAALLKRTGHIYYSPSTEDARYQHKIESGRKSSSTSKEARISKVSQLTFQVPEYFSDDSSTFNSLEPTNSEVEGFQDALNLVLSRNKALRTTQSEINKELTERTRWLHEELNWKRTLEEHAILHGKDPSTIAWRQWRDDDTATVKLRTYRNQAVVYDPEVVITVEYLKLYQKSPAVKNNKYKQIYVEYTFLSYDGIEMECPFSVPMSTDGKRMMFNFSKTFNIDPAKNAEIANELAEAIKNEDEIKFTVVGEPNQMITGLPCCERVSCCGIDLAELVEAESNEVVEHLPLIDLKNEDVEIGFLKVKISGVQAMRRTALKILAPSNYTIP